MKQKQKKSVRAKQEDLTWERTFFQRTQKELFFVFRIANETELEALIKKMRLIYERDRYLLVALIKSFGEDDFLP